MLKMKIELNVSEIWDLLKQGSTNQRNFIESLTYNEFKEFINYKLLQRQNISLIILNIAILINYILQISSLRC